MMRPNKRDSRPRRGREGGTGERERDLSEEATILNESATGVNVIRAEQ
jgi:hypothetical protein